MQNKSPVLKTMGWIIFIVGVAYMLGLGWVYSWRMVPAANQAGPEALAGFFGFLWSLAVPLGAFIVAIGAALVAQVERRTFWSLILIVLLFTAWRILGAMSGLSEGGQAVLPTIHIIVVTTIVPLMLLVHWVMRERQLEEVVASLPWWVTAAAWATMIFAIIATQGSGDAFIYFQF